VSDVDTAVVDSLKVLDPDAPIREADIGQNVANGFGYMISTWRFTKRQTQDVEARLQGAGRWPRKV
jgi:hypothetical protein